MLSKPIFKLEAFNAPRVYFIFCIINKNKGFPSGTSGKEPAPPNSYPSELLESPVWVPWVIQQFPLAMYLHMLVYMHPCYFLHLFRPLPLLPYPCL